jgi:hypothetical protein
MTTAEIKLKYALKEYFEDCHKEGYPLEDAMDDLEKIVKDTIDQQCTDNPITLKH